MARTPVTRATNTKLWTEEMVVLDADIARLDGGSGVSENSHCNCGKAHCNYGEDNGDQGSEHKGLDGGSGGLDADNTGIE